MRKSFKKQKNLIVVPGGGLVRNEDGSWRTGSYADPGDIFGLTGSRLRVVATSIIFFDQPASLIIASGGKGQYKNIKDAPTLAAVAKKELIELGVPPDAVIEESQSGTTFEGLVGLLKFINQKDFERLMIVSNGWHLPRIKVFIENCGELLALKVLVDGGRLEFVNADAVLIERKPEDWQSVIETAVASQALKNRLAIEKRGVEDIKSGRYQFKNQNGKNFKNR
jgi:hypothetical protein